MEFRLIYQGQLKANGGPDEKQRIRRAFHTQLRAVTKTPPYPFRYFDRQQEPDHCTLVTVGMFEFAPLINTTLGIAAEIHVLLLTPEEPGNLVAHGGDIDNRLKTLLDALSVPQVNQLPRGDVPGPEGSPFFCLLEDDALILSLSVTKDRLHVPVQASEVFLQLRVVTKRRYTEHCDLGMWVS